MLAKSVVAPRQIGEQFADRGPSNLDGLELVGKRAQRRGNVDSVRHKSSVWVRVYVRSSWSNVVRSSRRRHDVMSSGTPARTDTMTYEKNGQAWSRSYCDGRAG